MSRKVILGMSGGVDSSAAAILLMEKGYEVTGATLKLKPDGATEDIASARETADKLGIEHIVADFSEAFSEKVIDYFTAAYRAGRTPNPCVVCNKKIKFDALIRYADKLGCDYVATGHYANVEKDRARDVCILKKSKSSKDQSYFLYALTRDQLSRILFPLGDLEKSEVRRVVRDRGLPCASRKDSLEICFIPDGDYYKFINERIGAPPRKGKFVDSKGDVLGEHEGISRYTVGQRRGLGVSLGGRTYVISVNPEENTVTLGGEDECYFKSIIVENLNFISVKDLKTEIRADVKIRYRAEAVPALIRLSEGGKAEAIFDEPQKAAAPGQSAVFYDGDTVIGGGEIARAFVNDM